MFSEQSEGDNLLWRIMPQGDLLGFGPTVLVVGLVFGGGYYLWITWAAPRIGALLRARAWVTSAGVLVDPVGGWPEVVVLGLQFVILVVLLHWGVPSRNTSQGVGFPLVDLPPKPLSPVSPGLHSWTRLGSSTGGSVWWVWASLWQGLPLWGGTISFMSPIGLGRRVKSLLSGQEPYSDGLR